MATENQNVKRAKVNIDLISNTLSVNIPLTILFQKNFQPIHEVTKHNSYRCLIMRLISEAGQQVPHRCVVTNLLLGGDGELQTSIQVCKE